MTWLHLSVGNLAAICFLFALILVALLIVIPYPEERER